MRRDREMQAVQEAVLRTWGDYHLTKQSESLTPMMREPRNKWDVKPSCLEAKCCLCDAWGDKAWAMNVRLRKATRKVQRAAGGRTTLLDGQVVYNIVPLTASQVEELRGGRRDTVGALLASDGWVHLSMVYESPLRPTFRHAGEGRID